MSQHRRHRRPARSGAPQQIEGAGRRKIWLQGVLKRLAREYGVRLPKGRIEDRVSALAGESLDHDGAYAWLEGMVEQHIAEAEE